MEFRQLPLGIEDYKDLKETSYYVDKTFLVKEIVSRPPSSAILYARPRRFGKSLALSMLRYFFEEGEEDNSHLFLGTEIYKDKDVWDRHFRKYPVVYLNFKNVSGEDKLSLLERTKRSVSEEYQRHGYLSESPALSKKQKEYAKAMMDGEADEVALSSSLYSLTRFLMLHHGKRAIVLIDEYDTPLRVAWEKGYYEEVVSFYKNLYGEALKSNPNVYYAILTGILQVAKESLFSGLNNLLVNNVLSHSEREAFGFIDEEVDRLLSDYGLSNMKEGFESWYDGYLFGKNRCYNPLSVLSAIHEKNLDAYWGNTSEKGALYSLLTGNDLATKSLFSLLSQKQILEDVDLAISYKDLYSSPSYLFSYLLATGYLTVKERKGSSYLLAMPNKEIESVFEKEVIDRYLPMSDPGVGESFKQALLSNDLDGISYLLDSRVMDSFSYYEFNSEKEYQIMMGTLLIACLTGYAVKTEVNTIMGRSDLIAYPEDPSKPGLAIEIKSFKGKLSKKRLDDAAKKAVLQIKEKKYRAAFKGSKAKELIYYGFAFAGRSFSLYSEIESLRTSF